MFRSLKHANFRFFFIGQSVSLVGTWMQIVALGWLSYRLTHSPFLLGCVAFAAQAPSLFLSPFAGVLADRYDRRNILILAQVLCMAQASALALLVLSHAITIGHILWLSLFLGIVGAFEMTVRQSFLVELVDDKTNLSNAIALNSMVFNASRLLGPGIAGLLIASFGEGICFLVNAASYIAIIAALSCVSVDRAVVKRPAGMNMGLEFREGFLYAFRSLPIRLMLVSVAVFSIAGAVLQTLLPVFVKEVFQGGSGMFAFLLSVSGAGALAGTMYLARKRSVRGLAGKMVAGTALMGVGLVIFGMMKVYWVVCAAAFFIGLAMMVGIGGGNMLLQTLVEDDKRGRVMSLYAMALMGTAPFASLGAGVLAAKFGADATFAVIGVVSFMGAFLFSRELGRCRHAAGLAYASI